jgi:hypothetical protein
VLSNGTVGFNREIRLAEAMQKIQPRSAQKTCDSPQTILQIAVSNLNVTI